MSSRSTVLKRPWKFLLTIFVCLLTLAGRSQQNVYVDGAATGANNGSSWVNAYTQLSAALSAAAGGSSPVYIHVAKGTYYPTGNQAGALTDSAFTILRAGIKLYGGYPAGGGARDIFNNPVYLDGNINNAALNTDNSNHIMVIAGLTAATDSVVVDGFIFRNGNANTNSLKKYNGFEVYNYNGGALVLRETSNRIKLLNCSFNNNNSNSNAGAVHIQGSHPLFENCTFNNNSSGLGGAIFTVISNAVFSNCNFTANSSTTLGGAINNNTSNPVIFNCTFTSNNSRTGGAINNAFTTVVIADSRFESNSANQGGAISNTNTTTSCTITNTQFNNNTVSVGGGAIYQDGGNTQITRSQFIKNNAQYGGAIRNQGSPKLSVKSSVFSGNTSTNTGAAMSLSEGSDTLVTNLFVQNIDNSAVGGGALCITTGNFSIVNNTFYADTTTTGRGGAIRMEGSTGSLKLQNNIFYKCKAGTGNDVYNDAAMPYSNINNSFSIDPLFLNETSPAGADNTWSTADDGLALSASSSAINSGDITGISTFMTATDLAGNARIVGGLIDKGAYESTASTPFVMYVDSTNGNDANSGYSWALAHKTLAHSLQIANNIPGSDYTIYVAKGTYFPTGTQNGTDRDSSFTILSAGIKLYGGYPAGGGTRDIAANPVYLDGNINNTADSSDNSYHVILVVDVATPADSLIIDGFTIRNGNADGVLYKIYKGIRVQRNSGGGVFVISGGSYSCFSNCIFTKNTATGSGAGVYNNNSSPYISNCNFTQNNSLVEGGGMYNCFSSSPVIINSIFSGNIALFGAGLYNFTYSNAVIRKSNFIQNKASWEGGGIYNNTQSSPLIDSCIISENTASMGGGIVNKDQSNPVIRNSQLTKNEVIYDGGALLNNSSSAPQIDNCIISENAASQGAGIYNVTSSNPVIKNCSIIKNKARDYGGGIHNYQKSAPLIDSCIFSENIAQWGGGLSNRDSSYPVIRNSIFIKNQVNRDGGAIYSKIKSTGTFENCTFSENTATSGAGMYITEEAKPVIRKCRFLQGTASVYGGGLFCNYNSNAVLEECEFTGNKAIFGGAIWTQISDVIITTCRFEDNEANIYGGAILQRNGNFTINKSVFTNNSAQYGGAIRNEQTNTLSIKNSVFELNRSTNTGAALSLAQGTDTLVNNIFIRNKDNSSVGGGAICVANGNYQITNNTFYADSTSNGSGGAIRLESTSGQANIYNNIFYKCYAGIADNDVNNANGLSLSQSNNNFSIDPSFVNENDPDGADDTWGTADDGLALTLCSPAVNAGSNTFADATTVTDITSQPRIRLATIDQGAYEANNSLSLNEATSTLTADNNCGNDGWFNYYNISGNKIIVSIKPGTNTLGTVTATSNLRTGYSTNSTIAMTNPFGKTYNYYPFNRSWTVTTSNAPADSVGVRFYFGIADSSDVRNTTTFNLLKDLILYKVDGTNAWNAGATGYTGYRYGTTASKATFTLGTYQGLQYAEFYVTSFSSGTMAAVPPTALPLDLLSFSGKLVNDKTKLQWVSSNEVNVSHFEVERSNNNNSWSRIGQVQAGNATGNQAYELWDNNPTNGVNYYRLKMIDKDGQYTYSKMITIRTNGPSLQVYPNPNNGQFTIQIDNAGRSTSLQLFDANGKMVHKQQLVQGINQVNLKMISAGIYMLRIEDESQSHIERLIITK